MFAKLFNLLRVDGNNLSVQTVRNHKATIQTDPEIRMPVWHGNSEEIQSITNIVGSPKIV